MNKCPLCEKGRLHGKVIEEIIYGVSLGKFRAEVCDRCGEAIFNESESRRMTASAKRKGVWGLNVKTKVGRSGNSLELRLSKKLAEFLKLRKGKEVDIEPIDRHSIKVSVEDSS